MSDEELLEIGLTDRFYRDSFGKVVFVILSLWIAVVLLIATSVYLHLHKPKPRVFVVGDEWRVQPPVPVDQDYLSEADLLQWVTDALSNAFVFDFNHYNEQLKSASQYFTTAGWKVFLNHLNNYVNYNTVRNNKMYVRAAPTGAPYIINQGMLSGRKAWWVKVPLSITYQGLKPLTDTTVTWQVLVVRVPTTNNLSGVGIENMIVADNRANQQQGILQ